MTLVGCGAIVVGVRGGLMEVDAVGVVRGTRVCVGDSAISRSRPPVSFGVGELRPVGCGVVSGWKPTGPEDRA